MASRPASDEAWTSEPSGIAAVSARGSGWLLTSVVATALFQLVSAAAFGRLLSPREFGLVATAGLLLRLVYYFSQFGLGNAVVQKPQLSREDIRTSYALAVTIGVLACVVSFATAPVVTTLLNQRDATRVAQALSVSFLLVGIGTVPLALLRRQLKFRAIAMIETSSYLVGYIGVGLVALLLFHWGVWSLVAAALGQSGWQTAVSHVVVRPPLSLRWQRSTARPLVSFGGQVSVSGFLEFWSFQIDAIGVAHTQPPQGLGQYNRASVLVLPVMQASLVATRVLLSAFARLRIGHRLIRAYQDALTLLATSSLVVAAMLIGAHKAFVFGLLGPQWTVAADLLPWLAGATALLSLSQLPAAVCEAQAVLRPKLLAQMITLGLLIAVISTAAWLRADIWVYAACWTLAESLRLVLYIRIVSTHFSVSLHTQIIRYGEALAIAMATLIAVWTSQAALAAAEIPAQIDAVVAILVGGFVPIVVIAMWPRSLLRTVVRQRHLFDLVTLNDRLRGGLVRVFG